MVVKLKVKLLKGVNINCISVILFKIGLCWGVYLWVWWIVILGKFCDRVVMIKRGIVNLIVVERENVGVIYIGIGGVKWIFMVFCNE